VLNHAFYEFVNRFTTVSCDPSHVVAPLYFSLVTFSGWMGTENGLDVREVLEPRFQLIYCFSQLLQGLAAHSLGILIIHLLIAHHHQLLLLEGMEPGDKNVSFYSAGKVHGGEGGIGYVMLQVTATSSVYCYRHFPQEHKNHRDVMRCETPENILFDSYLADIESVGIQVLDLAQFAVVHQCFQP